MFRPDRVTKTRASQKCGSPDRTSSLRQIGLRTGCSPKFDEPANGTKIVQSRSFSKTRPTLGLNRVRRNLSLLRSHSEARRSACCRIRILGVSNPYERITPTLELAHRRRSRSRSAPCCLDLPPFLARPSFQFGSDRFGSPSTSSGIDERR